MNLKQIDNKIYEIWKKVFDLVYINPVNQKQEKRKFFSKENYNPQFKYKKLDFKPKQIIKDLYQLKKELNKHKKEIIAKLLKEKIDELILWTLMLQNRTKKDFMKYSLSYYGKPSMSLIKKASKLMKLKIKHEKEILTSKQLTKSLSNTLKDLKIFKGWKIKEKKNLGAKADDVLRKKTLYIKKGEKFEKNAVKRLLVHEIGTHMARAQNGLLQPYKLFFIGLANYESTEEALATIMESLEGVLSNKTLKNYAGRVLAINYALKHSFKETYHLLRKFFDKATAYQLTLRVKRGLSDTSKKGAFTKDYIYLASREKLRKLKEKDLELLFIGKISIQHLPIIKKLLKEKMILFPSYTLKSK